MNIGRRRELVAEFFGTAFLLIAVIGSGIAAERLSADPGLQLLINSFATAGALLALILAFGTISARFNPAVTLVEVARGLTPWRHGVAHVGAQGLGGCAGAIAANVMFGLDPISVSQRDRSSAALVFAEVIATLGLLLVVFLTARRSQPALIAPAVAGYIAGAYFFTASTSFANPAVTVARILSDTFAGIRPASVPAFVAAQVAATAAAIVVLRILAPGEQSGDH